MKRGLIALAQSDMGRNVLLYVDFLRVEGHFTSLFSQLFYKMDFMDPKLGYILLDTMHYGEALTVTLTVPHNLDF